jgi:hypothetical protein
MEKQIRPIGTLHSPHVRQTMFGPTCTLRMRALSRARMGVGRSNRLGTAATNITFAASLIPVFAGDGHLLFIVSS